MGPVVGEKGEEIVNIVSFGDCKLFEESSKAVSMRRDLNEFCETEDLALQDPFQRGKQITPGMFVCGLFPGIWSRQGV